MAPPVIEATAGGCGAALLLPPRRRSLGRLETRLADYWIGTVAGVGPDGSGAVVAPTGIVPNQQSRRL